MVSTDRVFSGSIAELYDRLMVPLIFEPYAADLAKRVAAAGPRDVLETAAGTGVVTRAMAARLAADVRITATDLNQPMIDHAKARQSGDKRISWKQADALALPFGDQSFDVVACEFGAMFFPDKVKGYKEARRVLKPGGRLLFNVWDKISENDFADTISKRLAKLFPDDPPMFMERTPHGYHDGRQIRASWPRPDLLMSQSKQSTRAARRPRRAILRWLIAREHRGGVKSRRAAPIAREA